MKKLSIGLFGLAVLLGMHFGSTLGVAIAVCAWMIIDGLVDEVQKSRKNKQK